jgi:hypothetical protein
MALGDVSSVASARFGEMATEIPSFDELVDLLRVRLRDADALDASALHSFKELMSDHADVIAANWYSEAFEELELLGHLHPASHQEFGGGACGRLSAEGRYYLRSTEDAA